MAHKHLETLKTKTNLEINDTTEVLTKIGRDGATKRHISVLMIRIYNGR